MRFTPHLVKDKDKEEVKDCIECMVLTNKALLLQNNIDKMGFERGKQQKEAQGLRKEREELARWVLKLCKGGAICYAMWYYTKLYDVMLYDTILCYMMLCYTILYDVMLCDVVLCYVMLCYIILCYMILYYVIWYYTMLYDVIVCYMMLCYDVILYYAIWCYVMWYYTMLYMWYYTMLYDVMVCYMMLWYDAMIWCYVVPCAIRSATVWRLVFVIAVKQNYAPQRASEAAGEHSRDESPNERWAGWDRKGQERAQGPVRWDRKVCTWSSTAINRSISRI